MSEADRPEATLPTRAWERREHVLEAFEDAWRRGQRPALADYLPAGGPDRSSLLTELVHSDLEYRLKAGEGVRVEDYLQRYPELAGDAGAVVGLIAAEWELRGRKATIALEEYLQRFPQYAEPLRGRLHASVPETVDYAADRSTRDEPAQAAGPTSPPVEYVPPLPGRSATPHLPDVPGYEVLGELGRGGMGVVYKARQISLKRFVALKMILAGPHAGPDELARFRVEAEAVARLQHANIVQIHEVGEHAGMSYFSLEFLGGGNLVRKLDGQPLPGRDAARLVETLARAMHYAHQQGVIHRDLKPANVLLSGTSETPLEQCTPKIADFGLAKRLDDASGQTATGALLGTPCYMAPEQAAGKVHEIGPHTDTYALGAILYELLTGRPPFQADTPLATVRLVLSHDPLPPSRRNAKVHRDLETICLKALAKEPGQRYESALALAEDLARFQNGDAVLARRPGALARLWRKVRRNPIPAASLAVVLLLAAGAPFAALAIRAAFQDREITGLSGAFEADLDQPRWTENDYLGRMDARLEALGRLRPDLADAGRQRLNKRFADFIEGLILAPALPAEEVERINGHLEQLTARDAPAAERLRGLLSDRLRGSQLVFQLKGSSPKVDAVFDPAMVRADNGSLVLSSPPGSGPVRTRVPCQGDVEFVTVFQAPSWETASRLALVLQAGDEGGYEFVLRVQDLSTAARNGAPGTAPTFAAARRSGRDLLLEVLRHNVPLRQRAVKASEVASGPLRLEAKRMGDRLLLQVNDLKPLEFQDVFPLGGAAPGVYALHWPAGVRVESLWAYRHTLAPLASPLERGDELYATGDLDAALREFRTQANTARQPEVRQEARYKEGLCLLGRNRPDEAAALFGQLAGESGGGQRWPLLARCQLWLQALRRRQFEEAEAQLFTLKSRYSFGELAALLPPEVRDGILRAYQTVGLRLLLLPPEQLVRNQQRILDVNLLLEAPGQGPLWARHHLLRCYRLAGDERQALRLADEVLAGFQSHDQSEVVRQTVVHQCWALRASGEPRRALSEVDRWLFAAPGRYRPDIAIGYTLLIERARIHAALDEWKAAEDDLDQFFRLVPAPAASAADPYVNAACLLQGFLRERRGDAAGAREAWNRGLPVSGAFRASAEVNGTMFIHRLILADLTDRLSDAEAREAIAALFAALGGSSAPGRLLQSHPALPAVLRRMWTTRRGREWAERIAYQKLSFAEHVRVPPFLLAAEVLHQGAFPEMLTKDQDDLLWQLVQDAYFRFLAGKVKEQDFDALSVAWLFGLGWEGALAKLGPPLRGPMTYVAGHRCLRKGKAKDALHLFELAQKEAAGDPKLARLARSEIEKLKGK